MFTLGDLTKTLIPSGACDFQEWLVSFVVFFHKTEEVGFILGLDEVFKVNWFTWHFYLTSELLGFPYHLKIVVIFYRVFTFLLIFPKDPKSKQNSYETGFSRFNIFSPIFEGFSNGREKPWASCEKRFFSYLVHC